MEFFAILSEAAGFFESIFGGGDIAEHAVGVGDAGERIGTAGEGDGFGQGVVSPLNPREQAALGDGGGGRLGRGHPEQPVKFKGAIEPRGRFSGILAVL